MATKKSGGLKWAFFLLVLAAVGGGGYYHYQHPKEAAPDYRAMPVTVGDIIQAVTANGQINPVTNVQVGSQVSGIIRTISVDFNSKVKEGDLIAEIDPSTFEANVTQAEGELMSSKAQEELNQVNYDRAKDLFAAKLIAKADYDKAIADLHQSQAMVKIQQASLDRSKIDLSRTKIYAPISGVVISRNVDIGQTVASSFNTPTLFLIANDLTKMQIDAMVSEADVGGTEVGQRVTFQVEAFPGRQFRGEVKQVRFVPTTNQNVVTYDTVVQVANDDLKLRPGMTANVSIITAQKRGVLRVPNAAFRYRPVEKIDTKPGGGGSSTNKSMAATSGTNHPSGAPAAAGGDGGSAGDGRPSREEMRKRFESMTPEQREAFRQQRMAGGGFGGMGGFGGGRSDAPSTRTVYVLEKAKGPDGKEKGRAKAVTIKTGISDGTNTEVIEGLKEGDEVITGLNTPGATAGPQGGAPQNPFGPRRF
ncbi:MAG TPA: efflux RND transporter periplasmic adaptor subunit [Verrucomicrobiae bacterium]|nr:efflux RND transporter periplasmic adaptor subunit [Verrucomicrobiae bacterium]